MENDFEQFQLFLKDKIINFASDLKCDYEIFDEFKSKTRKKPKNSIYRLKFQSFLIDFEYTYSFLGTVNSCLGFRFWLDKSESDIYFTTYDILEYLDVDDFKCYYFAYINDLKKMEYCFSVLKNFITKHLDKIHTISSDNDMNIRYDRLRLQINELLNQDVFAYKSMNPYYYRYMMNSYNRMVNLRFAIYHYGQYLEGNYDKTLKYFNNTLKLMFYEKRLHNFIKGLIEKEEKYTAVDLSKYNLNLSRKQTTNIGDLGIVLVSIIIVTFITPLPITLVYYLITFFHGMGSICNSAVENILVAVVCGLFLTICSVPYIRPYIYKYIFKTNMEQFLSYDKIMTLGWEKKFYKYILRFFIAGSMIAVLLFSTSGLRLYDEEIKIRDTFDLQTTIYYINDIEYVEYLSGRYSPNGNWVERPSYVLHFQDGTIIDLDKYADYDKMLEYLLPKLQDKNIPIK